MDMKYKRQKKVKSILRAFNVIGFEPPYRVVLDGTLTMAALNHKVNLAIQIPSYFGCQDAATSSSIELCTTKCVIKELEKMGSYFFGALHILKQFTIVKCAHNRKKIKSAVTCLKNLTEGEIKYIFASQDKIVQEFVEKSQLPLLYLHYATLVLKKPSFLRDPKAIEPPANEVEPSDLSKLEAIKDKEGLTGKQVNDPVFEKRREKLMSKIEQRKKERLKAKEMKLNGCAQFGKNRLQRRNSPAAETIEMSDVKSRCRNRKKRRVSKIVHGDLSVDS